MGERPGFPSSEYPSEGRMIIEELIKRQGLTLEQYSQLNSDEKGAIVDNIRSELKPVLESLDNDGQFSAEDANEVRDRLNIEKWHSLAEVVSFVKTIIGETTPEQRREIYERHLALGVDANELRTTLTKIYDVRPARIDTDIKHQSPLFYRAIVEITSNALDATKSLNAETTPIGRFGVGFYQILNHLNDPEDRLVVLTRAVDAENGIRIEFRNNEGQIDFRIEEDDTVTDHGTRITLRSKEFKQAEGQKVINEFFSHTQSADIALNGENIHKWKPSGSVSDEQELPSIDIEMLDGECTITDRGIGMDARVVFEKLLVPKLSDKPPIYEIREKNLIQPSLYYELSNSEAKRSSSGEIIVQVGDIQVEKLSIGGFATAKTLVVDLPPSTLLGEQRDEVEVDEFTIDSIQRVIDQAVDLPAQDCFEVINALGPLCRNFQNRSKESKGADNIYNYLQRKVRESFSEYHFLPNSPEFSELNLGDQVALLDPAIHQTSPKKIPELSEVPEWRSGRNISMFKAPFKEGSVAGYVATDAYIIVDERIDLTEAPEVSNHIIELASDWNSGSISARNELDRQEATELEPQRFETLAEFISARWQDIYFTSQEAAEKQAGDLISRDSELTDYFTQQVFSNLYPVSATEAWDILEYLVSTDEMDHDQKMQIARNMGENITALMGNETLRTAIKENNTAIFSMFEPIGAELPGFIKSRMKNVQDRNQIGWVELGGKKYYGFKYTNYNGYLESIHFLAEDGTLVIAPDHKENLLFKSNEVTITKDGVITSPTGEPMDHVPESVAPWFDNIDNLQLRGFEKDDSCSTSLRMLSATDSDGRKFEIRNQKILIDGEQQEFGYSESYRPTELLQTESGKIIIISSNHLKDRSGEPVYDERGVVWDQPEKAEEYLVFDQNGELVWQYKDEEWSEKVLSPEGDKEQRSLFHEQKRIAARCLPIEHKSYPIADDEPILRITRYSLIGNHRYRQTIGYVKANGEQVFTQMTDEVNNIVLKSKYSWEASCDCCGVRASFSDARYGNTVDKEGNNILPDLREIPVIIASDFEYDENTNQWLAISTKHNESGYYLTRFDEKGNFISAAKAGDSFPRNPRLAEAIPGHFDLRDFKNYYRRRVPARLISQHSNPEYRINMSEVAKIGKRTVLSQARNGRYGYDYNEAMIERNCSTDQILEPSLGVISQEKVSMVEDFLQLIPNPEPEKIERLMYRSVQFRNLEDSQFDVFIPVFYEVEHLRPESVISLLPYLEYLSNLDSERFIQLVEITNKILPTDSDRREEVAAKIFKFYLERLNGESLNTGKNLQGYLSYENEYSNMIICDGSTLIQKGTKVPTNEIMRPIRPLVTFMQRPEEQLAIAGEEAVRMPDEPSHKFNLSSIIQWKRLQEGQAGAFNGNADELSDMVEQSANGRSREHIVREITHAIHFQALNSTELYVRELVQNAVDAMKSNGIPESDRNINIIASVTNDGNLSTSFEDPVGMDISTLVNYFLVPGESSKRDRQSIGFYGQGVYTLFSHAQEVQIKTGAGDGRVWYLSMKPVIEHEMVVDVEIDLYQKDEEFKGTVISKKQKSKNPYVDAAYVRDAVMTLTSGMSDENASIYFQREKINEPYALLRAEPFEGMSDIRAFRNSNNILTQHGLYVKELGEYYNLVPDFISVSLKQWGGLVIDLPRELELTRSRQDIANQDKMKETLNPAIQRTIIGSYLNNFLERVKDDYGESFPYNQLPYDYFVEKRLTIPSQIVQDAQSLMDGKSIESLERYQNPSEVIKLLTLLPIFTVGEHLMSLNDIRRARHANSFPFDQEDWAELLPYAVHGKLRKDESNYGGMNSEREDELSIMDNTLEAVIAELPEELKAVADERFTELKDLDAITRSFVGTLNTAYGRAVNNRFFYGNRHTTAHASQSGNLLSWNMNPILSGNSSLHRLRDYHQKQGKEGLAPLNQVFDTLSHEYTHNIEDFGSWSHDRYQREKQARVLMQFLAHDGVNNLKQTLSELGSGTDNEGAA